MHLTIGRLADVQIPLDDGSVSRRHAEIFHDPFDRWWVRDLGSRNGTYVNGQSVHEQVIHTGDTIRIGQFSLEVLAVGGSAPPTPPPEASARLTITETSQDITALPDLEPPRVSASHLTALADFGQKLLAIDDADQRRRELCRLMVRDEFRGRTAAVVRVAKDQPSKPPQILGAVETSSQAGDEPIHISRSLLRALLQRGEALLASNVPSRPAAAELSISPDVMPISAVACPICSDDQSMQVLYALLPPQCATGEWLALARFACTQYQHAETMWVARSQQTAHLAMERELEQARQIQSRLELRDLTIPGLQVAVGSKPCRWVGGDYVDAIPTPDGKVLLTIADTGRRGLPAALIAYGLHAAIHLGVRGQMSLADLMAHLNDYFGQAFTNDQALTMVGLLLEPQSGQFQCINCGHVTPLIVDASGQARAIAAVPNPPLGKATCPLSFANERLAAREVLVLVTDGIIELPTPAGLSLGSQRVQDELSAICVADPTLSVAELATQFTRVLDQNQSDAIAQDDRTFLLARCG